MNTLKIAPLMFAAACATTQESRTPVSAPPKTPIRVAESVQFCENLRDYPGAGVERVIDGFSRSARFKVGTTLVDVECLYDLEYGRKVVGTDVYETGENGRRNEYIDRGRDSSLPYRATADGIVDTVRIGVQGNDFLYALHLVPGEETPLKDQAEFANLIAAAHEQLRRNNLLVK